MTEHKKKRRTIQSLRTSLAEYLIQLDDGQRLPSTRELAKSMHMSLGSVSIALNDIQDLGAVKIQNRGHLGSIVLEISRGKLWNIIQSGPLVVGLTLPMHARFEGLATGIKTAFEKIGVETYLIFIRGSSTRLKALRENRCHAIVMSGLAAEEHCTQEEEIIFELDPGTWISKYCIFYRTLEPGLGRPLRVAVDHLSGDHMRLSELVFTGKNVEFKSTSYIQIPRLLKNGEVDATVWTFDQADSFLTSEVHSVPISDQVMETIGARSISAAFICRSGNIVVRSLFKNAIHSDEILSIQAKVSSGELIPEY